MRVCLLMILLLGMVPNVALGNVKFTKQEATVLAESFKKKFGGNANNATDTFEKVYDKDKGIDDEGMMAVCVAGVSKEKLSDFNCKKFWADIIWTVFDYVSDKKEGAPCPIQICSNTEHTISCKWRWVPDIFKCVADVCEPGYKAFDGICRKENPVVCDEKLGAFNNRFGDGCIRCKEGYIAQNGVCKPCPSNKKAVGNKCVDFSCPSDSYKSYGKCHSCGKNMVPNADQSKCVSDKTNHEYFKNACARYSGVLKTKKRCVFVGRSNNDISAICDQMSDEFGLPIIVVYNSDGSNACLLQ